jgi:hypothetical protein
MSAQSADNLLRHTTSDEFAVVCSRIEAACAQHKFGVINSVDMQVCSDESARASADPAAPRVLLHPPAPPLFTLNF